MDWVCFLAAWTIVLLVVWNIWTVIRDITKVSREMHKIPCANCQFYTGSYYLKCSIHPQSALTEEAIGCLDYESQKNDRFFDGSREWSRD